MLTVENIRNPQNVSGFSHVRFAKRGLRDGPNWKPYQAETHKGINGERWQGPRRSTAEEAAQDYCDYINGNEIAVATLSTAGHETRKQQIERDPEYESALGVIRDFKAQEKGKQGYVYLIGVEGDDYGVKIGYSVKPPARCGELQTGNPRKLFLLASFEGTLEDERRIHAAYLKDNLIGEWFRPSAGLFKEFGLRSPFGGYVSKAVVDENFNIQSVGLVWSDDFSMQPTTVGERNDR